MVINEFIQLFDIQEGEAAEIPNKTEVSDRNEASDKSEKGTEPDETN